MLVLGKTKTIKKTIVLLLLISYACKEQRKENVNVLHTDTEKLNLKGRIKSRTGYAIKDSVKTITFKDNFNEIGFLIERNIYNFHGNVWINETYDYKNNILNKISSHFPKDNTLNIKQYTHNGNITTIHHYENTAATISEIEKFDLTKNKIYHAFITDQDTLSTFFKYDHANNLISETLYANNQQLIEDTKHTFNDYNLQVKTEKNNINCSGENTYYNVSYLYDDTNNKIGIKTYKNDILDSEEKIIYNNKKNIEHQFFNKNTGTKIITYTYDSKENIITEQHEDLVTNRIDNTIYLIEYYD